MNHLTAWPLLDHFLDGTLESESRWAVAAHMAECATCQAYLAEQAHMRAFVRNQLSRVAIPEGLANRIQTTIREAKTGQTLFRWSRLWRIPMVAASLAGLVLLAVGWYFLPPPTPGPGLEAELAISHLLFAQDETLLEISGTQAEIQAWSQDKVSFLVMTPDLPHYTFLGGRIVAMNGQRAVQLVYENEPVSQYLSLLYFEAPLSKQRNLKPAGGPFRVGQYGETTVVTWPGEQALMALVANKPVAELLRLAEQIGNK
jgi:anti-sigma factor RsiW